MRQLLELRRAAAASPVDMDKVDTQIYNGEEAALAATRLLNLPGPARMGSDELESPGGLSSCKPLAWVDPKTSSSRAAIDEEPLNRDEPHLPPAVTSLSPIPEPLKPVPNEQELPLLSQGAQAAAVQGGLPEDSLSDVPSGTDEDVPVPLRVEQFQVRASQAPVKGRGGRGRSRGTGQGRGRGGRGRRSERAEQPDGGAGRQG